MRLFCNRQLTLIHLATLVAFKNDLKEDEWPNFEFYPCLETTTMPETALERLSVGGALRPFRYNTSLFNILQILHPGEEDYVSML